jgi:hypothetical protein
MDNFVHNAANKMSEFLQYVLVISGTNITLVWDIPQVTTLRGMGWWSIQTKPW